MVQPPARQWPDWICAATSSNSSALGWESASTKISQSPLAAAAPQLRARALWFTGSHTTVAPAARTSSDVRSVELLSHTMSSDCQLRREKAAMAALTWRKDSSINRSSLNAGITTEIRIGNNDSRGQAVVTVLALPSSDTAQKFIIFPREPPC